MMTQAIRQNFISNLRLLYKPTIRFSSNQPQSSLITKVTSKAAFDAEIANSSLPVLVKFSAPWCPDCKASEPYVTQIARQYQGKFKVVEAVMWDDSNPDNRSMKRLTLQYRIKVIPLFVLINKGQEIARGEDVNGLNQNILANLNTLLANPTPQPQSPALSAVAQDDTEKPVNSTGQKSILYLCTGNSVRSQMAEGWTRQLKGTVYDAYSAGITAKGLDPRAVAVMKEAGVDISHQKSKPISDFVGKRFDYVVTVCDDAAESCPVFPGAEKMIHHSFQDPHRLAANAKTEAETLGYYRKVRDEIKRFVEALPQGLAFR